MKDLQLPEEELTLKDKLIDGLTISISLLNLNAGWNHITGFTRE
jgi:hypothetical protein